MTSPELSACNDRTGVQTQASLTKPVLSPTGRAAIWGLSPFGLGTRGHMASHKERAHWLLVVLRQDFAFTNTVSDTNATSD